MLDAVEKETLSYGDAIPKKYVNKFFENKPYHQVSVGIDYPTKTQLDLIREFRDMVKPQS